MNKRQAKKIAREVAAQILDREMGLNHLIEAIANEEGINNEKDYHRLLDAFNELVFRLRESSPRVPSP